MGVINRHIYIDERNEDKQPTFPSKNSGHEKRSLHLQKPIFRSLGLRLCSTARILLRSIRTSTAIWWDFYLMVVHDECRLGCNSRPPLTRCFQSNHRHDLYSYPKNKIEGGPSLDGKKSPERCCWVLKEK
jgi:hypothetical protein